MSELKVHVITTAIMVYGIGALVIGCWPLACERRGEAVTGLRLYAWKAIAGAIWPAMLIMTLLPDNRLIRVKLFGERE